MIGRDGVDDEICKLPRDCVKGSVSLRRDCDWQRWRRMGGETPQSDVLC